MRAVAMWAARLGRDRVRHERETGRVRLDAGGKFTPADGTLDDQDAHKNDPHSPAAAGHNVRCKLLGPSAPCLPMSASGT
jgi:hypothetical protein